LEWNRLKAEVGVGMGRAIFPPDAFEKVNILPTFIHKGGKTFKKDTYRVSSLKRGFSLAGDTALQAEVSKPRLEWRVGKSGG
jgi:hypothetical protein